MATDIRLKKSSVAGRIPDSSNLEYGELAINYQDGKLYYKNAGGGVKAFLDSANISSMITERQGTDSGDVINIINSTVDSSYVNLRVPTNQELRTTSDVEFNKVNSVLDGAIQFTARNESGGTLTKGTVVYISGISGNTPTVDKADADDASKMPAFGIVAADANNNSNVNVYTFGTLSGVDTSAFSAGDTLYVSTTAGELTSTPPAGSSSLLQNIGRVIRSDASAGSIKVGGAGRTNAVPNLDAGYIFYGNDSNRAVSTDITTIIDSDYIQARQVDLFRDSDFIKTVQYLDNESLVFGTGNDFSITHNGTNNVLSAAAGHISLQPPPTGEVNVWDANDGNYLFRARALQNDVQLYNSGTIRLQTLDSGVNITGNLRINNAPASFGIDSSAVIGIVDSDYVLNRASASFPIHNQDSSLSHYEKVSFTVKTQQGVVKLQPQVTIDSSTPELVDIDFVFAGIDSSQVLNLIDSAYIKTVQYGDNDILKFGDAGDLEIFHDGSNSQILEKGTGSLFVRSPFIALKNQTNTEVMAQFSANSAVTLYYDNSKKFETVDSGINITGNLRINNAPATFGLDSSAVTALITANAIDSGVALQLLLDSSEVVQLIDSSYVQARQSGGEITIQEEGSSLSTAATTLNFVGSGVTATGTGTTKTITISGGGGGGGTTGSFNQVLVNSYTGDSSTTAFTLSSAPVSASENSVVVTINGVTQHVNSYSLSGAVITLDSAPETGDEIEMRVHDDYTANIQLRDYKSYVYTPSSSTTAFTGSDDNGATLTYDAGKVEVYLNGSRLVSGTDYTETNSSTITLGEAIDSPDTLEIVSLAKAAIADFGVAAYDSDFTTTTADQIIHTFPAASFRTVKYIAQIEHDSDNKYHSEEILLAHNGTTVAMTTYSQVLLDSNLGTFDADISGTDVRLKFTPTYTNTSVKLRAIRVNA